MTTDERLDRIEKSIENLARSMDSNQQHVMRYLLDFRSETINRLEIMDSRLTTLTGLYQSVEARMAPLSKAILDFGGIANRLQIEQSRLAKLVEPAA
jgi:hypothetical protein